VADVVDPLAGSYYVESLTDQIEADALALIAAIDELGGAVAGIDGGFQQREIESAAYDYARAIDAGDATVVGLNRFEVHDDVEPDVTRVDEALGEAQVSRLNGHRAERSASDVAAALAAVTEAAKGSQNVLYPMKEALVAGATIGEITDALLPVFGRYRPSH
jgi:methylmalonyl-CoA mutase N-terminal domain/subunit